MSRTRRSTASAGTSKRDGIRERVLDAAALEMNLAGSASLDLVTVGKAMGMTRNALYHYVKNRDDLVYQAYCRSAEALYQDLQLAREEGQTLAALITFIRSHLAEDRREQVVLKNVDSLPSPARREVAALTARNTQAITELFSDGMTTGVFRNVNPEVATQVLLGLMDWAQLWYRFTYGASQKAVEKRAAAAMVIEEIMLRGISGDRSRVLASIADISTIGEKTYDIFDERDVNEQKRRRLIGVASRLFNERGIEPTSMDDVAAAINSTKGVVYHYFENKNELLVACQEQALNLLDAHMQASRVLADNPLDELLTLISLQAQAHATSTPPLIPQSRLSSLPNYQASRVVSITQRLYDLQDAAVMARQCRLRSHAVIDLSLGASTWVGRWLDQHPRITSRALSKEICSIYCNGLLAWE